MSNADVSLNSSNDSIAARHDDDANSRSNSGSNNETKHLLFRPALRQGSRPPVVRLSIRDTVQRFVWSYRMQSYLQFTLAIAYHLLHLALLIVVVLSPLTMRSLQFREEEKAYRTLTANDEAGTKLSNVWTVDIYHPMGGEVQRTELSLFHIEYAHGKLAGNGTSSSLLAWEASPMSLLVYYYFYMIISFFLLVVLTQGRLTGHLSLLQLIFGGMELVWYIRHEPASFRVFIWLAQVSSAFPAPWVPFAKVHPSGEVTYHVFNHTRIDSRLPLDQMQMTPDLYTLPHAASLEGVVYYSTVACLAILLGCVAVNFQRVLDAIVGVRELGVSEGCRRCPLCGEEWELSVEAVGDSEDDDDDELDTMLVNTSATVVIALPHDAPQRRWRHRCHRLFLDRASIPSALEPGMGSSSILDPLNDDDDDEEGEEELKNVVAAAAQQQQQPKKKPLKLRVNRSFVLSQSYGTMTPAELPEARPLYNPFSDREDEFRPGNAFPSLEDAGWLARATYSWLNPLMGFSVMDGGVLRHQRFLPSLPDDFTSLQNIAAPAWQLWVNRWSWFGATRTAGGAEGGAEGLDFGGARGGGGGGGAGGGDDDESSDDKTYVTISQRRPLTGAKLRPKRPKRSLLEDALLFVTTPLRWVLRRVFVCFFISGVSGRRGEVERTEGKQDQIGRRMDSTCRSTSVDSNNGSNKGSHASRDMGKKVRGADMESHDIGLFTPFLEHRSGRRFMYSCTPMRILSDALSLTTPAIVYRLIAIMEKGGVGSVDNALGICGILMLVLLARAVLQQEYVSQLYLSSLEAATAIKALVLEKTLALPLAQRTRTEGEVIHLMTVDAARCSSALLQLHQSWRCPCLAAAALYVLHLYVGTIPTLATLAVALLSLPLQRITGSEVHTAQQQRTARTVDRVELVSEAVTSMRQVKAMGAEDAYLHRIHVARQEETRGEVGAMEAVARAACVAEGIGVLLTSTCYTAYYFVGGPLTADVVVPALVAMYLLRGAVSEWPALVAAIPRGYASLRRIEGYLQQAPDEFLGTWVDLTADWSQQRGTVICHGGTFTWQDDGTPEVPTPVLRDVHMLIQPGELVVVQGPVGAGKSTLLLAVLGEVNRCCNVTNPATTTDTAESSVAAGVSTTENPRTPSEAGRSATASTASSSMTTRIKCGRLDEFQPSADGFYVFGRSVYCSETPWLQNDTIRANIVLDDTYNTRWYGTVTRACALNEDFEALAKGDESVVGDKGVHLSAGQRVRVALARALYSRADVYVLDNVLASLDSRLQAHIIERVFHGVLRNRTVILATHVGLAELKPKRLFTVRGDGVVVEVAAEHRMTSLYAAECEEAMVAPESSEADDEGSDESRDSDDSCSSGHHHHHRRGSHSLGRNSLGHGRAQLGRFFSFMGPSLFWLVLSGVVQHVLQFGRDVWLSLWISRKPTGPVVFLLLYFIVGAAAAVFAIPRMRVSFHVVRNAINHIHAAAVERMFRAPVSYFDVNAGSTITGIFSRDQETADHGVGESLDAMTTGALQMLAIVLFNAVVNPWFVLIVPLTILSFHHVVERYLAVARQVRRLENKSVRGPVAILHEVLEGAPVIRCLGLKEVLREEYCKAMDVTNMASMIGHMADCWVNLRLELITVLMTTTAALLGVLFASYIMPPAFAGVAVVCCLNTSQTLMLLCRGVGAFQMQFVSVEQLLGLQQAPEEPLIIPEGVQTHEEEEAAASGKGYTTERNVAFTPLGACAIPSQVMQRCREDPASGPSSGVASTATAPQPPAVELVDVSAKYRESLPYALRHVNLVIYARERIGLIGRSGNGKSTVFNVLLRLVDVIEGGGIYVWGLDARRIPYPTLRRRFMLVPQDPLLIGGTWRSNMLLGATADVAEDALWHALQVVGLDAVVALQGGLDAPLHNGGACGARLSPGQRQLLWLARAVLQKPMFLLFDEFPATDGVETGGTIQRVLTEELAECTVLLIAHRVQTLEALCTRVVVIDNGTVSQVLDMKSRTTRRAAMKKKLESLVE